MLLCSFPFVSPHFFSYFFFILFFLFVWDLLFTQGTARPVTPLTPTSSEKATRVQLSRLGSVRLPIHSLALTRKMRMRIRDHTGPGWLLLLCGMHFPMLLTPRSYLCTSASFASPPIQFYVRKTEMLPLSAQHSGEQQHVDSAAHLQLTPQRACRRDGMFVFSLASSSSPILLFPVAATELGVDCAGLWLLLVKLKPSHVAVRLVCFLPSLHLVRACVCVCAFPRRPSVSLLRS